MANSNSDLPPRHLRTPEAARFLGLSDRTLEKHRIYGTGPVYSRLGGRVVYKLEDLSDWVAKGRRTSTHDPDAIRIPPARPQTDSERARGTR
jgi:predicted DNA-binding transcriptional regulator AlpA